jgi:hypothetical protein
MNRRKFLSARASMIPLHQLMTGEPEVVKEYLAATKSERKVLKKIKNNYLKVMVIPNASMVSVWVTFLLLVLIISCSNEKIPAIKMDQLKQGFLNPPDSCFPGVYWYFLDGNRNKKEMTDDLESMKKAGISSLIFLEVDLGLPKGSVKFMSEEWQDLFVHAINECERLGIYFTLGIGPGWTGSGGPWVKTSESMKHLTANWVNVTGPGQFNIHLEVPEQRVPLRFWQPTEDIKRKQDAFYEDVAVLAFPTPSQDSLITDFTEKALYVRMPYTSTKNVRPYFKSPAEYEIISHENIIPKDKIIDLTDKLNSDGTLNWDIPEGNWTIMRFVSRNNGAITRPAPEPGLGFECDKFDTIAFQHHLDSFIGQLISRVNPSSIGSTWTRLHMDSWEMGAQNWTANFRTEFKNRRAYDPQPYYPAYHGFVVGSLEETERFLWDMRITAQELVLEYHAEYLKKYAHKYGFKLSIEPYDMTPLSDMELGAVADVPMCEFWKTGNGFHSTFSCLELTSVGNVMGRPVVAAEAFTSNASNAWQEYPYSLKNQGDWAFCTGINKFYYHTWVHNSIAGKYGPGMALWRHGIRWDKQQPFWPLVRAYHDYIASCSFMLQQGRTVADVLFLTPEGAPHVFVPPTSILKGENDTLPDKKGYNYDGCTPNMLLKLADVRNNKIVFAGGAEYEILVLPNIETMTPALLNKIIQLVAKGATIMGNPMKKSPGLVNFPQCDEEVKAISGKLWGNNEITNNSLTEISYENGKIIYGKELSEKSDNLYPHYSLIESTLEKRNIAKDFEADGTVRYIHKKIKGMDYYFVSNSTNQKIDANCKFRVTNGYPECWNPVTKEINQLSEFHKEDQVTKILLKFEPYQSYFIVFNPLGKRSTETKTNNVFTLVHYKTIENDWDVTFKSIYDKEFKENFPELKDWSTHENQNIKYFSGLAKYTTSFTMDDDFTIMKNDRYYLDLGKVNYIARIFLNEKEAGTAWTAPWRVEITSLLKAGQNNLTIEVANLWPNRLIGDENFPLDAVYSEKWNLLEEWPDWLINNDRRPTGRKTLPFYRAYSKENKLLPSGLIGPLEVMIGEN